MLSSGHSADCGRPLACNAMAAHANNRACTTYVTPLPFIGCFDGIKTETIYSSNSHVWRPISVTRISPPLNAISRSLRNCCGRPASALSTTPWRTTMSDTGLLGPWVRRFLLEHLAGDRNLSPNTQKSYRDMLVQLLPFVAKKSGKTVDRLLVMDLSAAAVRQFLIHLELNRRCGISTRNQRLGGIHALAKFISENRPEYVS